VEVKVGERGCWHWSRNSRGITYSERLWTMNRRTSICLHGYGDTGMDIGHICMDGVQIHWDGAFEDLAGNLDLNIDTERQRSVHKTAILPNTF